MSKQDVHDTNTSSHDTDPRDADTMTVSKPLAPVTTALNFVDPKLNGRWVFSNQGFNNRVAALQLGVQDKPFVAVQIGGGDNQRFFFTASAGNYKLSTKSSKTVFANSENNQVWGRLNGKATEFTFTPFGDAKLNQFIIATKAAPVVVWTLAKEQVETKITLEPFAKKLSQVWLIHTL